MGPRSIRCRMDNRPGACLLSIRCRIESGGQNENSPRRLGRRWTPSPRDRRPGCDPGRGARREPSGSPGAASTGTSRRRGHSRRDAGHLGEGGRRRRDHDRRGPAGRSEREAAAAVRTGRVGRARRGLAVREWARRDDDVAARVHSSTTAAPTTCARCSGVLPRRGRRRGPVPAGVLDVHEELLHGRGHHDRTRAEVLTSRSTGYASSVGHVVEDVGGSDPVEVLDRPDQRTHLADHAVDRDEGVLGVAVGIVIAQPWPRSPRTGRGCRPSRRGGPRGWGCSSQSSRHCVGIGPSHARLLGQEVVLVEARSR